MNQLTDRLVFLIEYLDLAEATGDPNAQWEWYQLQFLNNRSMLTCDNKSRQVGWSFIAAAEAVAESVLVPRSTNIFVSVTQVEAAEKVRYANYCIEALDREVRPSKLIDNRTEVELTNGSRIISHPCRPPRGKARARVYLDEIAHYPRDEEIYTAAVPIITRGGVIRMGSSPLGASGKFWEIMSEALQTYPGYERMRIPWWSVAHLSLNIKEAREKAPKMRTFDRVEMYGTERLIHIFENMPLEDFQQEYECDWTDESVAWITWDEIKRNQVDAQFELLDYAYAYADEDTIMDATDAIDHLAQLVKDDKIEPLLAGGMDIGRRKNLTEIILVGKDDHKEIYSYRLGLSLDRMEFDNQLAVCIKLLEILPVDRFLVDDMGIGMYLAEKLEALYPTVVEGVSFTNESKQDMAVLVKVRMQKLQTPIPLERDLSYQIHSIKRTVTPSKRLVFDTAANEKHHADKFWAFALAQTATEEAFDFGVQVRSPLAGYRG